ncbi:MAG: carbohydrate ABC transporter permease [Clostridiales bacterium]|jgi:putative aldouronate transport system permease protein|nr:carbohydrate ABC transporter permease [Clostridiales bacterium]
MALKKRKIEWLDVVAILIVSFFAVCIVLPFYHVLIVSFTTQKEYLDTPFMLFPIAPTLKNYSTLFADGRILVGYRTTLQILLVGLPLNLLLTTSFAYGISRKGFPGRSVIFYMVLITMLFNGGIIPLYLLMKDMSLTNTLWSVILVYGVNTFYMIIMRNYFSSLPESLIESAKLDGSGEWHTLFTIILPISMPIMATITLFYAVDRWNEWYYSMIFIRKSSIQPLQLILRSIVIDSQVATHISTAGINLGDIQFTFGLKMAAIIVTMTPVMCVFPFLQKHFVKGVLVGAIKS